MLEDGSVTGDVLSKETLGLEDNLVTGVEDLVFGLDCISYSKTRRNNVLICDVKIISTGRSYCSLLVSIISSLLNIS